MIKTTTVLLAAVAASGAAQARPAQGRAADVAAVRAHIESIFQAFIDKDTIKLRATHGGDWRGFSWGSRRLIRGVDDYMRGAGTVSRIPKGQGMIAYRMSDFDVVFYGNVAVASFVVDIDESYGADTSTRRSVLMDILTKGPAGWVQVASATYPHPEQIDRQMSSEQQLGDDERAGLLAVRDTVWRAWFAGDTATLGRLVPRELTVLESEGPFGTRASVLASSRGFATSGAKLTRLAFPRTEVQAYGATVILYSSYETDLTEGGKTTTQKGLSTEIFVRRGNRWINTGWQVAQQSH